jgi:hypothetical protein
MRSYVATITADASDPETLFTLPSSPPTPCSQKVQFRYVVPGHVYSVEIDGYEQRAGELFPLGGAASGSRQLLDGDDAPVEPRWTTTCSDVTAVDSATTVAGACEPLQDHGVPGATAIEVNPAASLGALRCAGAGGEIASFDVLPESGALPAVLGVACPPAAPVLYGVGIAPGETYTFRIEATGAGGEAYGASCDALTSEGLTVTASCAPLSSSGALTIPISAILEDAGLACAAGGAASYVATLPDLEIESAPLPCTEGAHFTPLAPGHHLAVVEVRGQDGSPIATASCTGDVLAGAATVATCSVL